MPTTRTFGPLQFEDLEPKRFDDLVRQLAYDFKPWRRLEATGRSDGASGFEARGYEMISQNSLPFSSGDDNESQAEETHGVDGVNDRLWLVQCKRERSIGPQALLSFLDEVVQSPDERLHGLVFVAACDFSTKARDDFAAKCRSMDLEEWHLWGKAELEERLCRPENDHLLFAYFGISLTVRRRAQRADLKTRLAMKRKAHRMLSDHSHGLLLLRSPDAAEYPYAGDIAQFQKNPLWMVWPYRGMTHEGLTFCVQRHFAYLADDGRSWDAAMTVNDARSHTYEPPSLSEDRPNEKRQIIHEAWRKIPEKNQAWFEVIGLVPFENILEIDELGDEFVQAPHIYAPFAPGKRGPFKSFTAKVETISQRDRRSFCPSPEMDGRIEYFGADLRERVNNLIQADPEGGLI